MKEFRGLVCAGQTHCKVCSKCQHLCAARVCDFSSHIWTSCAELDIRNMNLWVFVWEDVVPKVFVLCNKLHPIDDVCLFFVIFPSCFFIYILNNFSPHTQTSQPFGAFTGFNSCLNVHFIFLFTNCNHWSFHQVTVSQGGVGWLTAAFGAVVCRVLLTLRRVGNCHH